MNSFTSRICSFLSFALIASCFPLLAQADQDETLAIFKNASGAITDPSSIRAAEELTVYLSPGRTLNVTVTMNVPYSDPNMVSKKQAQINQKALLKLVRESIRPLVKNGSVTIRSDSRPAKMTPIIRLSINSSALEALMADKNVKVIVANIS